MLAYAASMRQDKIGETISGLHETGSSQVLRDEPECRLSFGHSKGSVTSKYIHTLDAALLMAADTIAGYIQGLLDGVEFKQTAYALDRGSRKAALVRFLQKVANEHEPRVSSEEHPAA